MPEFSVELPGPAPAINSTYKVVHVTNALGKSVTRLAKQSGVSTWQDTLAWLVRAAKPRDWSPTRRIMVSIEWYSPRKRDCDSGVKAALDAVAVGLGIDDGCFLLEVPVNEIDKANPRTLIRVRTVDEGEQ